MVLCLTSTESPEARPYVAGGYRGKEDYSGRGIEDAYRS